MNRLQILIFPILLNISKVFCQAENKYFSEAEDLFNNKHYSVALPLYIGLLKKDPFNAGLNYKAGVCYMNSRSQKYKAITFLEKAISLSGSNKNFTKETDAPFTAHKLLGDAYLSTFKFESALAAYENYKAALTTNKLKDTLFFEAVNRKIEMCRYGKEFEECAALPSYFNPLRNKDTSSLKAKDTIFGNYSSKLSADGSALIYTFKIPLLNIQMPKDDERYFEPLKFIPIPDTNFLSPKTKPVNKTIDSSLADTIINITTIGASVDGQIVLSYKDDQGEGNIYLSKLIKNSWTQPEKLQKGINTGGWEFCENISADGKTLYFVSDRPGGFGGNDIYKCRKLRGGEWSKAVNLGAAINSPYNDEAPFIHPDGVTLYFSSNRNNPSVSYDNFVTTLSDSGWAKPAVVGYPSDKNNEKTFTTVLPGKSIRSTKEPEVKKNKKIKKDSLNTPSAEKENLVITFLNLNKQPLTILTGKVVDLSGKLPGSLSITVSDNISGEALGLYHADKSGYYSFIVPHAKNNNITYEADNCLFISDNINIDRSASYYKENNRLQMQPLIEESKTLLNNIFFKPDSAHISPLSNVELNNVLRLLMDNPGMKIKITHFFFHKKNNNETRKLSAERAKQVSNYLVQKGIDKKRISVKGRKKAEPDKNEKALMANFFAGSDQVMEKLELKIKTSNIKKNN